MAVQASELLEKIRQQFDSAPYPRVSLDSKPQDFPNLLYIHNLATAYYLRNQKVIDTKGKVILDAGCGSGWKSLLLAEANPGAKIVGVDLSEESIKFARQRLQFHGCDNAEFHTLLLEDLPKLGMEFDYINCDDVLYLLPDAVTGLQAMQAVLKPDGILRGNFHSALQRANYFRAQNFFKFMGLMDSNPEEMEIGIAREIMSALKDNVNLKSFTWNAKAETDDAVLLANHLLVGDKGFTVPQMFDILRAAGLEFINMVNWQQWDLMELFEDPDNLPAVIAMSLPESSIEERLHIYELLNPIHRLLDFWCGNSNQSQSFVPIEEWTTSDWENVQVHIHPQLKTENFKKDLVTCLTETKLFQISDHLAPKPGVATIDTSTALCLVPLLNAPQTMMSLVERWKKVRPVNPITLEPTSTSETLDILQKYMTTLESFGYVMLERLG